MPVKSFIVLTPGVYKELSVVTKLFFVNDRKIIATCLVNTVPGGEFTKLVGKFRPVIFQNLSVKNKRIFEQKLLVLPKFCFIHFCKIPKYFHVHEYRNYLLLITLMVTPLLPIMNLKCL
jgi:hypothetical protein